MKNEHRWDRQRRIEQYIEQAVREHALKIIVCNANKPADAVVIAAAIEIHSRSISETVYERLNHRMRLTDRKRGN